MDSHIGRGSFGTVAKAEDIFTGSFVAIKVLHSIPDLHPDSRREEKVYDKIIEGCRSSAA